MDGAGDFLGSRGDLQAVVAVLLIGHMKTRLRTTLSVGEDSRDIEDLLCPICRREFQPHRLTDDGPAGVAIDEADADAGVGIDEEFLLPKDDEIGGRRLQFRIVGMHGS